MLKKFKYLYKTTLTTRRRPSHVACMIRLLTYVKESIGVLVKSLISVNFLIMVIKKLMVIKKFTSNLCLDYNTGC